MMKHCCWVIIVLMVCVTGYAIGDWSILRQADWQTHFRDVVYADAQHLWAVGDSGVIAASADGGQTWSPQNSGVEQDLRSVVFADAKTGWIAGTEGIILHTVDGGSTWQKQDCGTTEDMSALYFLDAKVGWAAGGNGTICYTTDGGANWSVNTVAELAKHDIGLYDIHFVDANTGCAVGGRPSGFESPGAGEVLLTDDGGKTWTPQNVGLRNPLLTVYFADKNTGWTSGSGVVWKTGDGGKTWESALPPPPEQGEGGGRRRRPPSLSKIVPDGSSGIWGISNTGRLVRLVDGSGMEPVQVPERGLTDVAFASPDVSCVVGQYGAIFTTEDGGQSWVSRVKIKASILRSVAAASEENIWSVGADGAHQSNDGGKTWTNVDIGVGANLYDVSFADANNGWILARKASASGGGGRGGGGTTGVILKTSDGGKTWNEQASGSEYVMADVSIIDSQNVYMSGNGGALFSTKDGGNEWIQQDTGIVWDIVSISFADGMNGFASSAGGLLLRTNDGGATWTRLTSYTSYDTKGVFAISSKKAWVVGNYGLILATDDGGDTWNSQRCYSYDHLNAVYFADANHGWVVGDSGKIFATTDGGKTWTPASSPTKGNLRDIQKGADGSLLVAGEWGTIIKGI